jgi:hypothetical protein
MQKEKKSINYPRKIARIFLKVLLFLFLFIVLIFLLILTPPVQRFMTAKVENFLENKLKTNVDIGGITFGLSGNVSLSDVYLEDQKKDTLLAGQTVRANLNYWKLFNGEVIVKDIEMQNITAKIKRVLPDTTFNYQFIVDAFVTQSTAPDTAASAPMKLSINDITLENINVLLQDGVTGNDMQVRIGNMAATIDSLDLATQHYDIPTIILRNTRATVRQYKPLVTSESAAEDVAEAAVPPPMNLNIGVVDLTNVALDYGNDISAFYTSFNLGRFRVDGKLLDLQNRKIHLDEVVLANAVSSIRLGRKEAARVVEKEIEQEVETQAQLGWEFRVDRIRIDNNKFKFDNDNNTKLSYGLDFAHMNADSLTLHADNFLMKEDSLGVNILAGSFTEQSGFQLDELRGNILYAYNQTAINDLYIKTPGTEIKRSALLEYPSYEALTTDLNSVVMNVNIVDSRVQVKDILAFAPQLRTHPAFRNSSDIWYFNVVGSGTMDRLSFESIRFNGLGDTQLDAEGTLASLTNPNNAGGSFRIHRFHTTQSDITLLTGQALTASGVTVPQSVDINGTVSGNAARLATNLNINTSMGFAAVNGTFANLTNPSAASYNARVRTGGLQIGRLIGNNQLGSITASMSVNGRGLTPATMNTTFNGYVNSFGFNRYNYRNVALNGTYRQSNLDARINSRDPNAFMNVAIAATLNDNPSFRINGMIDSLKTLPLNFTTQPLSFHGKINGDASNLMADNPTADVRITDGLLVTGTDRLPLDTVHLLSGNTGTENFITLSSGIVNADIRGQYSLADMGNILQDNIQPYFSVASYTKHTYVKPYDFRFRADLVYHPVLASFIPGFTGAEPIHAEGRIATAEGLDAKVTTPYIAIAGNVINELNVTVNTSDSGMAINGGIGHLVSGNSMDVYNVTLAATALRNNINFILGIDDRNGRDKYNLGGMLTQPNPGYFTLHLNPDSLLLNYDRWTASTDNSITITPDDIIANNFALQKDGQQLLLQSGAGTGSRPLNVQFTNFRLGTITGFMKSDSLLIDGTTNGNVVLNNIMKQPTFTSDLTISDLSLRQDTIGNVHAVVSSTGSRYNTDVTVTGKGNDVALTGYFAPQGKDMVLDLDLAIRRMDLATFEGALKEFVTSASGSVNGNVAIKGTTSKPDVTGKINFDTTTISTVVLGGPLTINDETLNVTNDGFVFDQFSIRDSANNALTLDGSVLTNNFINYNFDLDVKAQNFRAMNTRKTANALYYGDMNISTNLHVAGTEKAPVVDGTVNVNNGTDFTIVIPQAEPGVVQREGVVEFVDFDNPGMDSMFMEYDSLNVSAVTGFDVAATIEIAKEAKFNVIVDVANGDFLALQGTGILSAGIDPSGKITLTGPFEIEQGAYRFSFNFLQRNFQIEKGSKITWLGEPTSAELDVTAIYEANIASVDLVADQIEDPEQRIYYQQKMPFQVLLNVDGELMKPQLTFDIQLPENRTYNVSGDVESNVRNRLAQIRQEESEMTRQVFSILLLGRFVGENPFQSQSTGGGFSAGSFARQSVSKLLTEQLNDMAAGLIGGVDINFDVASSDDYTSGSRQNRTDLSVGLSKRLLNDRVTVTVGNNFQLEGPSPSNQGSNNIAGNVSVNYALSKDGRYMLRFYRKNEYEGQVDGYVIETGLGFSLSVDYNRFRQIFEARKNRKEIKKREEEQKKQQEQNGQKQEVQTTTGSKG